MYTHETRMAVTIGIFGTADGFAYRARRTRAGEFYESKRVETRSEATYEAIGNDVGRRFETESANGVTTFDADSCEALDFVSMETWREDKARFEAISAMKTFGMHRLWKSFVIMGKHARVRKFRRMRRTAAEASAFFGASTSAGAVSGALDVREATATIEDEVRIFRRGEREADRDDLSASTYDLDLEGGARTIAETYDADSLRAALEKQTEDNRQTLRDVSARALDAIRRAKDSVQVQFQERFDESLRPMMAATKKYKLIRGARSSATKAANGGDAQTLRSLFPHTERALMSKVSRKLESFERVAWMMFKASVMNARAESLREIHALLADDSGSNDRSPPLFSVSFDFESSALDPAPEKFVETFRSAANEWSASAVGESMHADAPRDVFVVDDGDFDSQVSDVLRKVESIFDTALDVVNAVLSPLRAEAQSLANALSADADAVDPAEDESSILGDFTHLAKRASLFKKECNKLTSIRDGCVEVSVQTAKRALNPIVSAPLERASERSLARVAEASQNLATKITKTRMEREDTGAPISQQTIESIREDAARIDRVHTNLEECGVRVPEMQTASFDALKSEIDALENERREDDDSAHV